MQVYICTETQYLTLLQSRNPNLQAWVCAVKRLRASSQNTHSILLFLSIFFSMLPTPVRHCALLILAAFLRGQANYSYFRKRKLRIKMFNISLKWPDLRPRPMHFPLHRPPLHLWKQWQDCHLRRCTLQRTHLFKQKKIFAHTSF